jgi:PHD/YefM family antitoxin component YafN of YafNO toxin-antitoxin module
MLSLHPQYVIDEQKHPQAVLLTLTEWGQIMDELEELDDIRAYDRAKSTSGVSVPFAQAVREIEESYGA